MYWKQWTCSIGLLLMTGIAVGQTDESKEPPLKYEIQLDGTKIVAAEGEIRTVSGRFEDPKIKIVPRSFRDFPYMGVAFSYPREYVFEADLSDDLAKSWSLSGRDLTILLFDVAEEMSTLDFGRSMLSELGQDPSKTKTKNIKAKFGNLELPGSSLEVVFGSTVLRVEIMKLPSESGQTKLIVLQDALNESGKHSQESAEAIAKLKSTFKYKK